MKLLPLLEALVFNVVLISLLVLISGNYGLRLAYWRHEGFTSNMVRYPFFFITSATNGSTTIPGILSVDWQQVVLLVIAIVDIVYLLSVLRAPNQPSLPAR